MHPSSRPDRQPLVAPGAVEHHVADLTATFAADVTLAAAQESLARAEQWLPIDGDPSATVGELVARNSTGPMRLGYGAWRDLLLGAQFTNGAGQLITAGGRAVKNVAGYDLTKFMVGNHGIFGGLVTITTRTYRRPRGALVATFDRDVARLSAMLTTTSRPQWAMLTRDALTLGYLGDEATIEFYNRIVKEHRPRNVRPQTVEQDIAFRARDWSAARSANPAVTPANGSPGATTLRAAVPPSKIMNFTAATKLRDWVADPAFGVVLARCAADERTAIDRAARDASGSVRFFTGDGRPIDPSLDPGVRALLERLKYAFDPDGKLAPL